MNFKVGDRVKIDSSHERYKKMRCFKPLTNESSHHCNSCLYHIMNINKTIFTIGKITEEKTIILKERFPCFFNGMSINISDRAVLKLPYNWIKIK